MFIVSVLLHNKVGWDCLGGIVTCYGLDNPGIESQWGRDFSYPSSLSLGPTQPPVQWVQVIARDKGAGIWH